MILLKVRVFVKAEAVEAGEGDTFIVCHSSESPVQVIVGPISWVCFNSDVYFGLERSEKWEFPSKTAQLYDSGSLSVLLCRPKNHCNSAWKQTILETFTDSLSNQCDADAKLQACGFGLPSNGHQLKLPSKGHQLKRRSCMDTLCFVVKAPELAGGKLWRDFAKSDPSPVLCVKVLKNSTKRTKRTKHWRKGKVYSCFCNICSHKVLVFSWYRGRLSWSF